MSGDNQLRAEFLQRAKIFSLFATVHTNTHTCRTISARANVNFELIVFVRPSETNFMLQFQTKGIPSNSLTHIQYTTEQ